MPRRKRNDLALVDSTQVLDARTSELARRAYALRQRGSSMYEIASELGLAENVIAPLIRRAMQQAAELVSEGTKQELLSLEVARLDQLQRAVWPAAMGGDARSVEAALKVIAARAKLLGLEEHQPETIQQAVIVTGDSKAYIQALRGLVPEAIEEA